MTFESKVALINEFTKVDWSLITEHVTLILNVFYITIFEFIQRLKYSYTSASHRRLQYYQHIILIKYLRDNIVITLYSQLIKSLFNYNVLY